MYSHGAESAQPSPGFGAGFYGVNYDLATSALFAGDKNEDSQLAALDPGTIRWPGGTEADFYNWKTGTVPHNKSKFTLTDLYNAWVVTGPTAATRATPMFDLNVLSDRAHPQQQMADQIAMLQAAEKLGLPVHYVELGNELYFPGPSGAFQKGFATGTDYGTTVGDYVTALHKDFPGVQVAADGVLHPAANNPREDTWNAEMLSAAGTAGGSPDAVILHDYPGPSFKNLTSANLPSLFGGPYKAVSDITTAAKTLDDKPIWLTEYNLDPWVNNHKGGGGAPNPVQLTYAHELFLAELSLMLPRADHVSLADSWSTFGKTASLGDWANPPTGTLTPGGQAVQFVDTAGHGASSSETVTVPGAPTLPDGQPGATGQAFSGSGNGTTAVFVNLTDKALTVPVGTDVPAGAPYEQVSGNPTVQQTAAGTPNTGTVGGTELTLPAYSVTLVNATTT